MNTFDSNKKKEKDFIIFRASSVLWRWAHWRGWQWSRLHFMNGPDCSTLPDVLARGPDGSLRNLRPSSSEAGGGRVHTFHCCLGTAPGSVTQTPMCEQEVSMSKLWLLNIRLSGISQNRVITTQPWLSGQDRQNKHTHTQARATLMIVTYLKVAWKLAHYDNSSSQ